MTFCPADDNLKALYAGAFRLLRADRASLSDGVPRPGRRSGSADRGAVPNLRVGA